ncbi:MAG: transglycosylase domain-containing protein [bacterium JZ-2024 1]
MAWNRKGAGVPGEKKISRWDWRRDPGDRRRSWMVLWILRLLKVAVILVFLFTALFVGMFTYYLYTLPPLEEIKIPVLENPTTFYGRGQVLIARLYTINRVPKPLEEISPYIKQAFIAIEDQRFYAHHGVDFKALLRSTWANVRSGRIVQGGGTITSQLARNAFLSHRRTFDRKLREIVLALALEKKYTKDKILEAYLNLIYFGNGVYGVESAAQLYFEKSARDVTLEEAALLAAIPRGPKYYDPYTNPKRARERRDYILKRIAELGMISEKEAERARKKKMVLAPKRALVFGGTEAPYFVAAILNVLKKDYSEEFVYRGLRIETGLHPRLQRVANRVIAEGLAEAQRRKLNAHQAALVAMDAETGDVLALVGGSDFLKTPFERITQAHRQVGSAFKPFVYYAALKEGFSPDDTLVDERTRFFVMSGTYYEPKNFDHRYRGVVTLWDALKHSINVVAIKLNDAIGPEKAIEAAHSAGIESLLQPVLSLPLGTSEVTPLELTRSFCTIANLGTRVKPRLFTRVLDSRGALLKEIPVVREPALDPDITFTLVQMMKKVITEGTGRGASIGVPTAGKTGTTSDYRDAWFVGFTPRVCATVWFGNDDNTPMNRMTGGTLPAPVWRNFMLEAIREFPAGDFGEQATAVTPVEPPVSSETSGSNP